MNRISIFNDINIRYQILKGNIITIQGESLVIYAVNGQKKFEYRHGKVVSFYALGDYVYFQDVNINQTLELDSTDFKIVRKFDLLIDINLDKNDIYCDNFLLAFIAKNEYSGQGIIQLPEFTIHFVNPLNYNIHGISKMLAGGKCLAVRKETLSLHSYLDTNKFWEVNYNELLKSDRAELFGRIYDYEGHLYFTLSDYEKSALFCINKNNGTVAQKTDNFGGFLLLSEHFFYVLNPFSVKLLNTKNFEISVVDFTEMLAPLGWRMDWKNFAVSHNVLFFVHQSPGGGGTAIIGALSIDSPQLLWHTIIPIETGKYWVASIRVEHEKLYVLTQGGTLYVFGDGIYEAQPDKYFKI